MTTRDVFIWELLDRSPFLRSYLTEIEMIDSKDEVVRELLQFYRELDEMIDIFRESSVLSLQSSARQEDEVASTKNQEAV